MLRSRRRTSFAPAIRSFDDALATARVVTAAYQVGGMLEMLDMSVAHSNTRVQFGTPIGRFQRVQDHIIRLLNAMDAARWATYEAAWAIDAGRDGVARSYLAGSTASDSYIEAANAAHEVHAAIGSDPQYGLTLYTRISRTMYELWARPAGSGGRWRMRWTGRTCRLVSLVSPGSPATQSPSKIASGSNADTT